MPFVDRKGAKVTGAWMKTQSQQHPLPLIPREGAQFPFSRLLQSLMHIASCWQWQELYFSMSRAYLRQLKQNQHNQRSGNSLGKTDYHLLFGKQVIPWWNWQQQQLHQSSHNMKCCLGDLSLWPLSLVIHALKLSDAQFEQIVRANQTGNLRQTAEGELVAHNGQSIWQKE